MLPGAPAEWSFIVQISELDRGLIFSLSLCIHTHTRLHTRVHVCVLAVTAVTKLWFYPGRPCAFRPL